MIANKAIFDSYVFRTRIKLTDLYAKRSLLWNSLSISNFVEASLSLNAGQIIV